MSDTVISVDKISKLYRLGEVGTGTLRHDFNRWWHKIRGKEDPYEKVAESNDRATKGSSEYVWALQDVGFEVKRGEVLGIIGRNGAGKSTLLKILSRVTKPTSGEIKVRGRIASLLEVGTGFNPDLTGRENVYLNGAILGMRKREIDRKFDEIVAFAEVERYIDTPVKRYSSGMYVRLAFAVAAHLEPEILIIDEVLAVGDAQFQKKCLGKMHDVSSQGRTVLFVSHNMGAVVNLCTRGIVFKAGKIAFNGGIEEAAAYYNQTNAQVSAQEKGLPPHIVYQRNGEAKDFSDFAITKIELLDQSLKEKPVVSTWDSFTVRIHYSAGRRVERGAVVLQVTTMEGVSMLMLSTQPDGTLPLTIEVGENLVDCHFEDFPLAAGEFLVNAGMAIPQMEWLCWNTGLGVLTVHPKDVYSSGLAPASKRCMIATTHTWSAPSVKQIAKD